MIGKKGEESSNRDGIRDKFRNNDGESVQKLSHTRNCLDKFASSGHWSYFGSSCYPRSAQISLVFFSGSSHKHITYTFATFLSEFLRVNHI